FLFGCGTTEVVNAPTDASRDATHADRSDMLFGTDAGPDSAADAGNPGCDPIAADASAATQPCGKTACDPLTQYCEIFYSGIPMNPPDPPYYSCKQAPKSCANNVACACLKQCLPGNPFTCKDDAGAYVSVAGQ